MPKFAKGLACVALLCLTLPIDGWAFGHSAHRLICAVAIQQLKPSERAEVDRLSALFRTPDGRRYQQFTQGCTFADTARGKSRSGAGQWGRFSQYNRWHFLNVPRSTRRVSRQHCDNDCVLHGIDKHFRDFANHDLPESRRALAMLLMSHWIADVHQPLHISFEDDRGGNLIRIAPRSAYQNDNLHAVWDNGILAKIPGSKKPWSFAHTLNESITEGARRKWRSSSPIEWAQESYDITVDPNTAYCRWKKGFLRETCNRPDAAVPLDASYQANMAPVILDRIRKAGTRLADYLSRGIRG